MVALACLSYLNFRYFDSDITDDEVDGFIIQGEYVLHQYSQSNFLHHIRGAWRDANEIPNVRASSGEFLKARWNPSFRHAGSEIFPSSSRLVDIQSMDAEVYEKLNIIAAHAKARNVTESTNGLFLRCTRITDYQMVSSHFHVSRHGRSRRAVAVGRHLPPYRATF